MSDGHIDLRTVEDAAEATLERFHDDRERDEVVGMDMARNSS